MSQEARIYTNLDFIYVANGAGVDSYIVIEGTVRKVVDGEATVPVEEIKSADLPDRGAF